MEAVHALLRRSRSHHHQHLARSLPQSPSADNASDLSSVLNDILVEALKIDLTAGQGMEKRQLGERAYTTLSQYSPAQLASMEAAAKASAIANAHQATIAKTALGATATTTSATGKVAAQAATKPTSTAAATSIVGTPKAVTSTTTSTSTSTTAKSSTVPTSTMKSSTTTTRALTTSTTPTTSSSPTVLTVTQSSTTSAHTSSATSNINSAAAAEAKSGSKSMSTGATVGVVIGALIGVVILGSCLGFLYRKYKSRSYKKTIRPWSKLEDSGVTPYRDEKPDYDPSAGDIYGTSAAPVIGSRRALALARQNAFNTDGSFRPESDYMVQRDGNRAGVGAGGLAPQSQAYAAYPSPQSYSPYGIDPQGRPYNPQAGRTPLAHNFNDVHSMSPPGYQSRQLAGPSAKHPDAANSDDMMGPPLTPMAMGRPDVPTSEKALAQHEDFDLPLAYDDELEPHTPQSAVSTVGAAAMGRSRVSMPTPKAAPPPAAASFNPELPIRPSPAAAYSPTSLDLPALAPMSPLMSDFAMSSRNSQQQQPFSAMPMYEDEPARQKRMYGEVAHAIGAPEPITPRTPGAGLGDSTSSATTFSSFSASEHQPVVPRLPIQNQQPPSLAVHSPPQPYVHGMPLSPLAEVPTPSSGVTNQERNPFDDPRMLPHGGQGRMLTPYSSTFTHLATGVPSPAYPPSSPGAMSVPGSVTDSPRRWSGERGVDRVNRSSRGVYDDDDAYGGI